MRGIEQSSWRTPAAYLYTLGLDEVSLAWEYLRRNPSYQATWFKAATRSKCVGRRPLGFAVPGGSSARRTPSRTPLVPVSVLKRVHHATCRH